MAARLKFWKGQHRHAIRRCSDGLGWSCAAPQREICGTIPLRARRRSAGGNERRQDDKAVQCPIGYAIAADALSEVSNGAKWDPDPSFNVAGEGMR
jgi:hypothetical protein